MNRPSFLAIFACILPPVIVITPRPPGNLDVGVASVVTRAFSVR